MKKTLLIAGALLALTAGMASATGVNLYWVDCSPASGGAGVANQNNPCTSNVGSFPLIVSLRPGAGVDTCVGVDAVIDIQTSAPALSPWWQMKAGGCRPTSLSALFAFSGSSPCPDPWAGQAFGGLDYAYNPPDTDPSHNLPNRARLRVAAAVTLANAQSMDAGVEYNIFQVTLNKVKSVGTGACAGCTDAACFVLNQVKVTQPLDDTNGDKTYTSADQNQFATYQGAAGAAGCAATPTRNRTWGSVKSLYR